MDLLLYFSRLAFPFDLGNIDFRNQGQSRLDIRLSRSRLLSVLSINQSLSNIDEIH